MKNLFFLFTILCALAAFLSAQPRIDLVYPREGDNIGPVAKSFLIGSVTPGSQLWVNGQKAEVYHNGAFLAYIPFTAGQFQIKLLAQKNGLTDSLIRQVNVAPRNILISSDSLAIVHSTITPGQELGVRAGDRIAVAFRGTPGRKASFSIGRGQGIPMDERNGRLEPDEKALAFSDSITPDTLTLPGTYMGSYLVTSRNQWYSEKIYLYLVDTLGMMAVDSSQARISAWPESLMFWAVSRDSVTVLKTGPDLGYEIFLPPGVNLELTGSAGENYRVRLANNKDAWVKKISVAVKSWPGPMVSAKLAVARTFKREEKALVRFSLSRPCAFSGEASPDGMSFKLLIFGAQADLDWVRYDPLDNLVKDIRWRQVQNGEVELEIFLSQPLWGYDSRYQQNNLEIEIRPRPRVQKNRPLAGIKIAVDAGHSPENGAVGPLRTLEKEVNWQISKRLGNLLKNAGAKIYYPREGSQSVGIYQRPVRAVSWGADLLVSIHNNASPDGVNPLEDSGFSTYYYQPFSRDLAFAVHRQFQKTLPLPDHGFYYGNLALCRATQMPSFLVEPAFIIVPKEEALLLTAEFQEKIARSVFLGIKEYLSSIAGK
ncbi:N-acetylmuramoyl-L-alanine amidase [candidate division TA06 bacterium]|uniref:N-acetylmuramoyl-L-alanine amidase n=1 Tax=candidate division TA06 bacterium TaxID=2250710 RepID=A0A933IB01_UNCT6|nr:N-acetylmuramoyl-L-alanine amidase [candidate division TA06 bacterium]